MQTQPYPPFPSQQLSNTDFYNPQIPNNLPSANLDPIAEQQINQAVAQGFGQFFFNPHDPNIDKTNAPVKKESQMHIPIIITTILMLVGIAVGIPILSANVSRAAGICLLIIPYLIYLGASIFLSQIRGYITNLKKFDDYKQTYDKMVNGRGYFRFWIECYHYKTVRTKNGTRTQKVVTHTATQNYFPIQTKDESGNLTSIKDLRKYIFIKYLKRFYFTDNPSEIAFNKAYNSFISRNRKDTHQSHDHTFMIEGFQEEVGFCMVGQSPHNSIVFYLFTFFGLSLPYSCIIQRSVSRYEINILKRLTCA